MIIHEGRGAFLVGQPRLRNDLYCVDRDVKPYSLTHSLTHEGQLRPYCRGRGPSATQFWGFFLFMHTPSDTELPNYLCVSSVQQKTWLHTSDLVTEPLYAGGREGRREGGGLKARGG